MVSSEDDQWIHLLLNVGNGGIHHPVHPFLNLSTRCSDKYEAYSKLNDTFRSFAYITMINLFLVSLTTGLNLLYG